MVEEKKVKTGYVALVGRPNTGKSTLLNRILGQKISIISDKPQTTRISILGIKTTQRGQIIFIDNPGIHKPLHKLNKRMMNFVYSAFESAHLITLLIDASMKFGHGDEFVIDILKEISTPVFLLINKVDIVRKEKVLLLIDKYKDLYDFKEIIPISALKGIQIDLLEDKIYEYMPESKKLYADDEISTQSQKFFFAEIIREKLLEYVKEEIPFVSAVYIDKIQDRFGRESSRQTDAHKRASKYIKADIIVEKSNHRKIILGKHGQLIKRVGIKARKELESLLDEKIYLDLHVKVKTNWRDAANVLDLIEGQK
ncbi:MAG: GTPase Era [Candidatus Aminicenantaceae bacterium]